MAGPAVEPLGDDPLEPVVAYLASRQADPTAHVPYLAADAASIPAELAQADAWRERTWVARRDGDVVGVLQADLDTERGRVWWVGPWSEDDEVAAALFAAADAATDGLWTQQELAPDARNERVARLAAARGCTRVTPSDVLSRSGPPPVGPATATPLRPEDHGAVAALHDRVFPGTHTTGAALVADDDTTIHVRHVDGVLAGYVAVQVQADGGGYVDYLGVEPDHRRRGLARDLVVTALRELAERDATDVHLTVRHDATGARQLYEQLGFTLQLTIDPWRSGFGTD